jgi:hypothetical protein
MWSLREGNAIRRDECAPPVHANVLTVHSMLTREQDADPIRRRGRTVLECVQVDKLFGDGDSALALDLASLCRYQCWCSISPTGLLMLHATLPSFHQLFLLEQHRQRALDYPGSFKVRESSHPPKGKIKLHFEQFRSVLVFFDDIEPRSMQSDLFQQNKNLSCPLYPTFCLDSQRHVLFLQSHGS